MSPWEDRGSWASYSAILLFFHKDLSSFCVENSGDREETGQLGGYFQLWCNNDLDPHGSTKGWGVVEL